MAGDEDEAFDGQLTPEQVERLGEVMAEMVEAVRPALERQQKAMLAIADAIGPGLEAQRDAFTKAMAGVRPQLEALQESMRPQLEALARARVTLPVDLGDVALRPTTIETTATVGIPTIDTVEIDGVAVPLMVAVSLWAMVTGALAAALRVPGAMDQPWVTQLVWIQAVLLQWAFHEYDKARKG